MKIDISNKVIKKYYYEKDKIIEELQKSKKILSKQVKELYERNKYLEFIADTDEITALNNRYFFDKKIIEEIKRADNEGSQLSLIIFDLDHFKKVNDIYGHDVGDKVLIKTADITRKVIGQLGTVARWGGEEFIILLPNTLEKKAVEIAENLRTAIQLNIYPEVGHITASFGVCEKKSRESYESWFRNVDKALYCAKNQGRNRVVCCNDIKMKFSLVRLQWDESLICGNKLIDDQHYKLFELANGLMDLFISSKESYELKNRVEVLLEHVEKHFEYEEEVLKNINFPDADKHIEIHKILNDKVGHMKERFLLGELDITALFLFIIEDVVLKHILNEDIKFFQYIKKED